MSSMVLLTFGLLAQTHDTSILVLLDPKGQPLSDAFVHSADFNFQLSTNKEGIAHVIEWPDVDTLCFTSFGFDMKRLSVSDLKKDGQTEVVLSPLSHDFDEVLVVGRTDADGRSLPYQVDQISAKEVAFTQSQTSADALSNMADVFVQKSQMGGGSPIIRGFEASRVLLVVDGVRMNNAIYRSGHLQNAISVDASALSQMEVIYGPGSLLYGSDALGGVVHFRTKDPQLSFSNKTVTELNSYVRFASANQEKTGHVDFNLGGEKIAFWSSFTFSDFDDLQSGKSFSDKYPGYGQRPFYVDPTGPTDVHRINDDPYKQIGTAYHQFDMIQKLKWAPNQYLTQTFNFQYSTTSDIPRYDQLTEKNDGPADLKFAEWYYGPQKRLMLSSRTQWIKPSALYDKALLIGAFQKINEDRIDRRTNSLRRGHQEERVDVLSFTLDLEKALSDTWQLSYGSALDFNDVGSGAFSEHRNTGEIRMDQLTRYPDDEATMQSFGFYSNIMNKWSSHVSTNLGVRYSKVQSNIAYTRDLVNWPTRFYEGITNTNEALTWGFSLNVILAEGLHAVASTGSAFRAPNIDDLAKIRIKSGTASTPNPRLKPERSFHNEVTITQDIPSERGSQQISVTAFMTRLSDAIIQVPAHLPNGDSLLRYDDEWFRIVGNTNADVGRIFGVSANIKFHLAKEVDLHASINYIKGTTETSEGISHPMAHIPPIYGRVALEYELKKWHLQGVVRFNGAKKLEDYSNNSADNLEQATPEGTLAWATINLYAAVNISEHLRAQLALENIANTHYRPFASGLSAPGRNLALSLYAMI